MTDNPESAFRAYVRAFEALDPEAVLAFYHLPSIFIAAQGVFVASDANTLRALMGQFMGQLRAQSYRRTEVSGLVVRALSAELASCAGVLVRFNARDQEIARPGFTYTMRNSGGSWKIVAAVLHDPILS